MNVPNSSLLAHPSIASPIGLKQDSRPILFWINLSQQSTNSTLAERLQRFCEIRLAEQRSDNHLDTRHASASNVLVFEYDYPDMSSLNILRDARQNYPHIPIIMFTLQHSEELAVWALRNRVWDYYYKPLTARQINDIGLSLQQWFDNEHKRSSHQQFLGNGFPDEVRIQRVPEEDFRIDLAANYVAQHLSDKICEETLAKLYGISRFQFSRQFKKVAAMTFQHYLLVARIEKAKAMLKNPTAQIIDVAFAVGVGDAAYFTRIFKRHTGLLPSEWKKLKQLTVCDENKT